MRLAAAAIALVACRQPAPKCPVQPPIEIIQVPIDCLDGPPPPRPGPLLERCAGWGACLSEANARALAVYLAALADYADLAFTRCEPAPKPEE